MAATIPGGAYDRVSKTGWKANDTGTSFKYKNPTGVLGIIGVKIAVGDDPTLVKVTVKGKNLTLPATYPQSWFTAVTYIQLRAAASAQCGKWE